MTTLDLPDFFTDEDLQEIIKNTGGVPVDYRGQRAYFHCETPTLDDRFGFTPEIQGMARVLLGGNVYDNLEEDELITVDGNDWLVGSWQTPEDGQILVIYLKRGTVL